MAARSPAHVTIVSPEQVTDEPMLLRELDDACRHVGPIPFEIGRVFAVDGGAGGVAYEVVDPTGALTDLRDRLLVPPQRWTDDRFHVTVAHPRTSRLGPECFADLERTSLDIAEVATDVVHTATTSAGSTVLSRHMLNGSVPRHRMAGAVMIDRGRVLLARRGETKTLAPGLWDIVGGHIEPGESARTALLRELDEELGVTGVLSGAHVVHVDEHLDAELFIWKVTSWDGDVHNRATDEHDELRWVTVDELAHLELAHESLDHVLRTIFRESEQ